MRYGADLVALFALPDEDPAELLLEGVLDPPFDAALDAAGAGVELDPEEDDSPLPLEPESVLEELLLPAESAPAEPFPPTASAAVLPTAASLVLLVPPALLRKSVTYQPEPFSWKPAAVTCFS